ncbi:hypothetical protein AK88_01366, partial [Plasmodium fragile]
YHSQRPLQVSFSIQQNAHLETQTNRLLSENGMNDHVMKKERKLQRPSSCNCKVGNINRGSPSETSAEKVEQNGKANENSNSNTTNTDQPKGEDESASQEGEIKALSSEGNHTEGSKTNEDEEGKKEDNKENGEGGEKESGNESGDKDESAHKEEKNTEENKNLESTQADAEVSEHKHDDVSAEESKDSPDGENTKEGTPDNHPNEKNPEDAANGDKQYHLDNLNDKVPHYSALRNNRVEKGITDTMVLNEIIGDNTKSCSVNNGGCAEDQICIRMDNIGIKCICKEGHLLGDRCILMEASSFGSFFSATLSVLLALLWMCLN